MKVWRSLDTGAMDGPLNMGIDQALLQLHVRGESPPTLRFYQWEPPAVSLGYFQKRQDIDPLMCRSLGIDIVRRPTGGRAVLHQNDLTYSLIAGGTEGIPSTVTDAYRLVCKGLFAGFSLMGIEPEPGRESLKSPLPDVCFLRFGIGDIVHQGKKFVGSAQTWISSSMLQHGSIILEPQVEAWADLLKTNGETRNEIMKRLGSRITSLNEILGRTVDCGELKDALKEGMAQTLGIRFEDGSLTQEEWILARQIAVGQQGSA
ncbi:Octanoyltransferase LipM [uncultured Desulfobacterium sp.]|uniref:Octanoyltransferase LipM n=1 Tax=uncultured Desulfobacterium sp. TaxID=201089 RepID=A0A445N3S4_9BACT|nr:Octanoyltransferase LipM [uncultured Desulfobacterium sp.]